MKSIKSLPGTLFLLCILSGSLLAQVPSVSSSKLWQPQHDDVYLQEVAQKIVTPKPVASIAVNRGQCYAVTGGVVCRLVNDKPEEDKSAPAGVNKLISLDGNLWALASGGIYLKESQSWKMVDNREYIDICMHLGTVCAATREEIFRLEKDHFVSTKPKEGYNTTDITMLQEDGSQIHADPVRLGPVSRIASYSGTLYVLRAGKLVLYDGLVVNEDFIDWGRLPSNSTNDLLSLGSRLFIGTSKGLGVLRGASLATVRGTDGLPVENTTCLAPGFENDVWIGTSRGAVRMLKNEWQYFGSEHWLPGVQVNSIAAAGRTVYIATDKGIGIIRYEPYTLQKKAEFYERHISEWGHKRLGFIHTLYNRKGEWTREISDNDGGHTAPYLAAMSYKFAVTGDESARKEAVESFKALLWLERITPVRGFIARAIWSATADQDEMSTQGSGGLPAKWYPTKDGKWYWKGDTSSDEVTAHFYAVSLFYDLAARGEEKDLAREHLQRIAGYILKSGYVYPDMDGKPTRWGRWNPEYLLRPYGYNDRGVNSLEVLAFMQSAFALTGDKKFNDGLQQLVGWGYAENTIRQKNTFPPATLAPWDDNLAFESYNTLLRYTKDPKLRSIYLRSLERTWEIKRMEHIPWFNFSYGAITGNDCDLEQSVKHLREWTLDCRDYNYRNSLRDDLYMEQGYISYEGGLRAFSPRETCVQKGSRNATFPDGGTNGNVVREPTGYLRDYWMGRYYGFIKAPETSDPELIYVKKDTGVKGAKPFDGPNMPQVTK